MSEYDEAVREDAFRAGYDSVPDPYDAFYLSLTGRHLAPGGLTREQFLAHVTKRKEDLALEIWNSPGPRREAGFVRYFRGRLR
jgi:hypothetical protein